MNYEQRIAIIKDWFKSDIATRFTVPSGVDPKVMASDCIEILNSCIPPVKDIKRLKYILTETQKLLVKTSRTRTIPIAKDFSTAAAEVIKRLEPDQVNTSLHKLDPLAIAAKRIKAREPVGESYLKGELLKALLGTKLVSELDIAAYKQHNEENNQPF